MSESAVGWQSVANQLEAYGHLGESVLVSATLVNFGYDSEVKLIRAFDSDSGLPVAPPELWRFHLGGVIELNSFGDLNERMLHFSDETTWGIGEVARVTCMNRPRFDAAPF